MKYFVSFYILLSPAWALHSTEAFSAQSSDFCQVHYASVAQEETEFKRPLELTLWAQKNFKESEALNDSQKLAIKKYQNGRYGDINSWLRYGQEKFLRVREAAGYSNLTSLTTEVANDVKNLDSSFAATGLDRPLILYRAVKKSTLEEQVRGNIRAGSEFLERGYSSTSGILAGAQNWESNLKRSAYLEGQKKSGTIILRVHAPSGLPALYLLPQGQHEKQKRLYAILWPS